MPIYEFRCEKCETVFESWQKMSDPNPEKCPACGETKIEKLISSSSFILQGKGWYATDYGGKKAHLPAGKKAQLEDNKRSDAKRDEQAAAKAADKSPPSVSTGSSESSSSPSSSSSSSTSTSSSGSSSSKSSSGE